MDKLEAVKKSVAATAGPRPHFLKDPDSDRLLAMVLALAGELGTVYERLDTLESLLVSQGTVDIEKLNEMTLPGDAAKARLDWHEAMVRRILRVLALELQELAEDDSDIPKALVGE
ncbi:hypothetical protein [Polymorphobacter sp.]|uniref:hypothetical protein n=1 Tax=Polymorphobacter sp. TaxID=1909290 RepID=UPI003F6E9A0B